MALALLVTAGVSARIRPWKIAQGGVQPLFVVDLLQEVFDGSASFCEIAIVLSVDFLIFQRLQERFAPGIVVGISSAAHANVIRALPRSSKCPAKTRLLLVAALSRHVRKLPASLRRSLTWDRGLEMAKHKTFTVATNVKVYFCDPQSPWQRGTNENTNGLLRQYFPKRTDLSGYTQAELDKVAPRLNQRPRKTLGFETPASRLQASVATTH